MTCQGYLCHNPPGVELRLYRSPGRWGETKALCRDCYEAIQCGYRPWSELPIAQPERKPDYLALAADLARAQAQQCQPITPERAPTHPGAEEERIYLRDRVVSLTVALNEAYRFAEAIAESPLNLAERTAAAELQNTINAALAGKGAK